MTPDQQTALDIMAGPYDAEEVVDPRTVPVRFSNLKAMARSPVHYWQAVQRGFEETLPMRLGSGIHAMLFNQPWTVWTGSGNGKKPVRSGKAWDAFEQNNIDKTILSIAEYKRARAITESIKRKERAMELLFAPGTVHEKQINWTCLGRACSSRLDGRHPARVIELKSTKCSDPVRFSNDGRWRAYHAQCAFYLDADRFDRERSSIVVPSASGTPTPAFVIAVESTPPFPVTVLRLTERAIDIGRRMCRLWLERVLACEAEDYWPGYIDGDAEFDVPDEDEEGGPVLTMGGVPLGDDSANDTGGSSELFEEVSDDDDRLF